MLRALVITALCAVAELIQAQADACESRPLLELYAGYESRGQGALDDEVRVVQEAVGVTVDGDYGPNTVSAVQDYQREHCFQVDGKVGPETWSGICDDVNKCDAAASPAGGNGVVGECGDLKTDAPIEGKFDYCNETCDNGRTCKCWTPIAKHLREKIEDCFPGKFDCVSRATSAGETTDHPGNALDCFPKVSERACPIEYDSTGWKQAQDLSRWAWNNRGDLKVRYVIWWTRIAGPSSSTVWDEMTATGDCNKDHQNHVHISVANCDENSC